MAVQDSKYDFIVIGGGSAGSVLPVPRFGDICENIYCAGDLL